MKELETKRLRLRYIKHDDAQRIFDCWASDPEVSKYLTWLPHGNVDVTKQVVDMWVKEYENADCYRYGIELKEENVLIGMIDVIGYHQGNPVIGYCSGKKYWNHGYMTEAFLAVIDTLFSDGYETIVIEAVKENIGSIRVIEKAGFHFVGSRETVMSDAKPDVVTINSYRLNKKGVNSFDI